MEETEALVTTIQSFLQQKQHTQTQYINKQTRNLVSVLRRLRDDPIDEVNQLSQVLEYLSNTIKDKTAVAQVNQRYLLYLVASSIAAVYEGDYSTVLKGNDGPTSGSEATVPAQVTSFYEAFLLLVLKETNVENKKVAFVICTQLLIGFSAYFRLDVSEVVSQSTLLTLLRFMFASFQDEEEEVHYAVLKCMTLLVSSSDAMKGLVSGTLLHETVPNFKYAARSKGPYTNLTLQSQQRKKKSKSSPILDIILWFAKSDSALSVVSMNLLIELYLVPRGDSNADAPDVEDTTKNGIMTLLTGIFERPLSSAGGNILVNSLLVGLRERVQDTQKRHLLPLTAVGEEVEAQTVRERQVSLASGGFETYLYSTLFCNCVFQDLLQFCFLFTQLLEDYHKQLLSLRSIVSVLLPGIASVSTLLRQKALSCVSAAKGRLTYVDLCAGFITFFNELEMASLFTSSFQVLIELGYPTRFKDTLKRLLLQVAEEATLERSDVVALQYSSVIIASHALVNNFSAEPDIYLVQYLQNQLGKVSTTTESSEHDGSGFGVLMETNAVLSSFVQYVSSKFEITFTSASVIDATVSGSYLRRSVFAAYAFFCHVVNFEGFDASCELYQSAMSVCCDKSSFEEVCAVDARICELKDDSTLQDDQDQPAVPNGLPQSSSQVSAGKVTGREQILHQELVSKTSNSSTVKQKSQQLKKPQSSSKLFTQEISVLEDELRTKLLPFTLTSWFVLYTVGGRYLSVPEATQADGRFRLLDSYTETLYRYGAVIAKYTPLSDHLQGMVRACVPLSGVFSPASVACSIITALSPRMAGEVDDYNPVSIYYVIRQDHILNASEFLCLYPVLRRCLKVLLFQLENTTDKEVDQEISDYGELPATYRLQLLVECFNAFSELIAVAWMKSDVLHLLIQAEKLYAGGNVTASSVFSDILQFAKFDLDEVTFHQFLEAEGLLSDSAAVRLCVLNGLTSCTEILRSKPDVLSNDHFKAMIDMARNDENSECRAVASSLYEALNLSPSVSCLPRLQPFLESLNARIRSQAAVTIVALLADLPASVVDYVKNVLVDYQAAAAKGEVLVEKVQNLDPIVTTEKRRNDLLAKIHANDCHRSGLVKLIQVFLERHSLDASQEDLRSLLFEAFDVILAHGVKDRNPAIRGCFLDSGLALIGAYGGESVVLKFINVLQPFIDSEYATDVTSVKVVASKKAKKESSKATKKKSKVVTLGAKVKKVKKPKKSQTSKQDANDEKADKKKAKEASTNHFVYNPAQWQYEGAIVLLGALAKHLLADEAFHHLVPKVIKLLFQALRSPNVSVHRPAAKCLGIIAKLLKSLHYEDMFSAEFDNGLSALMKSLEGERRSSDLAIIQEEKRGLCIAVATLISVQGIRRIKELEILTFLETHLSDTDHAELRIVALTLLDELFATMKLLFEPYFVFLFPFFFSCFADNKKAVRDETKQISRNIMKKISLVSVDLILPSIIANLDGKTTLNLGSKQWRVKEASIRLIGSMAYLEKRILSKYLPQLIPRVISCFGDTHLKIRVGAKKAMKEISTVAENPEIKAVSGVIVKALLDPETHLHNAIVSLNHLSLKSQVDTASLALLLPLLQRGLRENLSSSKMYAAGLLGRIISRIGDDVSLVPLFMDTIPLLLVVLVDPVPSARSTAAKSLRSLVFGLVPTSTLFNFFETYNYTSGDEKEDIRLTESNMEDMVDQLMNKLLATVFASESGVERSGGANGVVELLGTVQRDEVIRAFLERTILIHFKSKQSYMREGVMWIFVFLPKTLGIKKNVTFVRLEFLVLFKGLSDASEGVRNTALTAGRTLVNLYGGQEDALIIRELMSGLSSPEWRVRVGCLTLLNELLFALVNRKSKANAPVASEAAEQPDQDIEEGEGEEKVETQASTAMDIVVIAQVLGAQLRNLIFSKLFILRSDSSPVVRSTAGKVWKCFVYQSGKLVKMMLGELLKLIIQDLKQPSVETKVVAAMALGELITKHSERVLPRVIPFLENKMRGEVEDLREATLCLVEITRHASPEQLEAFFTTISHMIEIGITCTLESDVASYSAICFDLIYTKCTALTCRKLIPKMIRRLELYEDGSAEHTAALYGLKLMIEKRSAEILPVILPKLLKPEMSQADVDALRGVCSVSSSVLSSHIRRILAHILKQVVRNRQKETEQSVEFTQVVLDICNNEDADTVLVMQLLLEFTSDAKHAGVCFSLLQAILGQTSHNIDVAAVETARCVLDRFSTDDEQLLEEAEGTLLKLLSNKVAFAALCENVDVVRGVLRTTTSRVRFRKGAGSKCLKSFSKEPIVLGLATFYKEALVGTSDPNLKEIAILGLKDVVIMAPATTLNARIIIKITGPMIRAAGEKHPVPVKVAIFSCLRDIVSKGGMKVRALVPQLMSCCTRSLVSESPGVRFLCVETIQMLANMAPRAENLFKDLADTAQKCSLDLLPYVNCALDSVLYHQGSKLNSEIIKAMLTHSARLLEEDTTAAVSTSIAYLVGRGVGLLSADETHLPWLTGFLESCQVRAIDDPSVPGWLTRVSVLSTVLEKAPQLVEVDQSIERCLSLVATMLGHQASGESQAEEKQWTSVGLFFALMVAEDKVTQHVKHKSLVVSIFEKNQMDRVKLAAVHALRVLLSKNEPLAQPLLKRTVGFLIKCSRNNSASHQTCLLLNDLIGAEETTTEAQAMELLEGKKFPKSRALELAAIWKARSSDGTSRNYEPEASFCLLHPFFLL